MQRGIEQADGHGQAVHRLEDSLEVVTLERQQLTQRRLALGVLLGEDQALDVLLALAEEHVLGPAQPDALSAHPPGAGGVLGVVGVVRTLSRRESSAWLMI